MFEKLNQLLTWLTSGLISFGNFIVNDPLLSVTIAVPVIYMVMRFFKNLKHK